SADFFVGFCPTKPPGASTSGGFHSATVRRPCEAVERLTTPTWLGSTPRNVATVAPGVTEVADATITCGVAPLLRARRNNLRSTSDTCAPTIPRYEWSSSTKT